MLKEVLRMAGAAALSCSVSAALALDLRATARGATVQSPKVSQDGRSIAFVLNDRSGLQSIGLRSRDASRPVSLDARPASVQWLTWSSPTTVDLRAQIGGQPQLLRWDIEHGSHKSLLPNDAKLGATQATYFNNYAFTLQRFEVDGQTVEYDAAKGKLVAAGTGFLPLACASNHPVRFRSFGDPFQITWEWSRGVEPPDDWSLRILPHDRRQGTTVVAISGTECQADFLDSVGHDLLGLARLDLRSGKYRRLIQLDRDLEYASLNPTTGLIDVVGVEGSVPSAVGLDPASKRLLETLSTRYSTGFYVVDRSASDRYWLIRHGDSACRPQWTVFDAVKREPLWSTPEPSVDWNSACERSTFDVKQPGGPTVRGVLSAPVNVDCKRTACDLVVDIHGGPAARDRFRTTPMAAELTAAGYLVLNVNYRGSAGYGKAFESQDAGNWGTEIPKDIYRAMQHVERLGYRVRKKVAVGGSFGGYVSLLAAVRDEAVDCAVASSSTPNLVKFVESGIKRTGGATDLLRRVGDPSVAGQRVEMDRASPLSHAHRGKAPILLLHGEKDPQSPIEGIQEFVVRRAENAPISVAIFEDEAHELLSPANRKFAYSLIGAFIRRCSTGAAEPEEVMRPGDEVKVRYFDGLKLVKKQ